MMLNQTSHRQQGQSIILVAVIFGALLLFVAIAVDMSSAYADRRQAQNAADAAALGAAQELGEYFDSGLATDTTIRIALNRFAEANGIADTDGIPGNAVNDNVIGCYLNVDAECLDGLPPADSSARVGALGAIPAEALGIEAVAYITSETFFGGIIGADNLPLQAEAASLFEATCEAEGCVLPIAVHSMIYDPNEFIEGQCYTLWDGGGAGNFGWLNWTNQGRSCYDLGACTGPDCDCNSECLEYNLNPASCLNGMSVGEWVYGTVGVKNADFIRAHLEYYTRSPDPVQILVYDQAVGNGCGLPGNPNGLRYRVAGFGSFDITGFRLSHGQGIRCDLMSDGVTLYCKNDKDVDPNDPDQYYAYPPDCLDYPTVCEGCDWETGDINRITGIFHKSTSGDTGNCHAVGNLLAPKLSK